MSSEMKGSALPYKRIALGVGAACICVATPCRADDAEAQKTRSKALFEQGAAAIEKKDFEAGCKAMRESLELFVVANSLFQVAMCDEREMKLASALGHWKRGWALVDKTDPRSKIAAKKIEGLEKRVPRVKISPQGNITPIVVLIDEVEVSTDELQGPVAVDPGRHVVTVRKKGHLDKQFYVLVDEAQRTEVQVTLGAAVKENIDASKNDPVRPSSGTKLRTAAFISLGFGAVGIIGGAVTSGFIVGNDDDIDAACRQTTCDPIVKGIVEQQKTLLPVNAAAWIVGGLGAAAAAILFPLAAKSNGAEKPSVSIFPIPVDRGAGIGAMGRF